MFEINRKLKIHFVGIGGIGMSGIAEILISQGHMISGSDLVKSSNIEKLIDMGVEVYIGHRGENIKDATILVYSSAIEESNPEIIAAKEMNIPIMKRAEMLAELMRLKQSFAVAGTHGKTTTTSLLATILQESGFDPTYIIGGIVSNLNGHAKVGNGNFLVVEADESDGSFLLFNPIMSVITNIDKDHMEHYGSYENIVDAFRKFADRVPFYGCCAINIHDENLMKIQKDMKRLSVTFGIKGNAGIQADYEAYNINFGPSSTEYDLLFKGEMVARISIGLSGKHNVLNSLGAIALAHNMQIGFEQISESISKFVGIGRRFQTIYQKDNLEVIDDYAHHPTAIHLTLETVKNTRKDSEIIVIFEPHRFSRTKECWNSFHHCFNYADKLFLTPIYPASEKSIPGITAKRLGDDLNKIHPQLATVLESIDDIKEVLEKKYFEKTTIIVLGAGSIGKKTKEIISSML